MEDVLEVYTRGEDPLRPVVCLDEQPLVLHGEARPPLPATPAAGDGPGRPQRQDYEWTREGTASLFMVYAPFLDWLRSLRISPASCGAQMSPPARARDWDCARRTSGGRGANARARAYPVE